MARKRPKQRIDPAQGRQRLHVRLAPETLRRLKVACAMEDTAPGPYLERLIDAAARRYVVQDRPPSGAASDQRLAASEEGDAPGITSR